MKTLVTAALLLIASTGFAQDAPRRHSPTMPSPRFSSRNQSPNTQAIAHVHTTLPETEAVAASAAPTASQVAQIPCVIGVMLRTQ